MRYAPGTHTRHPFAAQPRLDRPCRGCRRCRVSSSQSCALDVLPSLGEGFTRRGGDHRRFRVTALSGQGGSGGRRRRRRSNFFVIRWSDRLRMVVVAVRVLAMRRQVFAFRLVCRVVVVVPEGQKPLLQSPQQRSRRWRRAEPARSQNPTPLLPDGVGTTPTLHP